MPGGKGGISTLNIPSRLTDDLDITDHGVLGFLILQETCFAHRGNILRDSLYCLEHVAQIIRHPKPRAFTHTGTASSNTLSRYLAGRDLGVRTST